MVALSLGCPLHCWNINRKIKRFNLNKADNTHMFEEAEGRKYVFKGRNFPHHRGFFYGLSEKRVVSSRQIVKDLCRTSCHGATSTNTTYRLRHVF